MASTAMRPAFLNEESLSLRSFRVNTLSNSPPSLKASSLKVKSSLAFSNLLRSRGRTTQKYPQPTLKDLTRESYEEEADNDFLLPDQSKMPPMSATEVQTEQAPLPRPRSKSRTIIRMLTTKFTPRAISSPTQLVRPPPTIPNAFSKDQRDAALRERGLLPPLRPNKDLSTQELELDQRIPIVQPVEESDEQSAESGPSAADLIKKEWVAKNHGVEDEQRERMNAFKFGGGSTPLASPSAEGRFPFPPAHEQLTGLSMVEQTSPPNQPLPPVPTLKEGDPQEQAYPPRSSSMTAMLPPPSSDDQTVDRSSSPLLELSAEIQAYMFPLPPSPSPSGGEVASPPGSPISPIPPPSPSLRSVPEISQSLKSDAGESGANTPRPLEESEPSKQLAAPAISLTPPTAVSSPTSGIDETLTSAFHVRTDSFALLEESITSIMTPSLDSTSQTTANSTTGTTDSNSNGSTAVKGPGKLGMLQVKTHEAPTIPVIVESPVEASRFSEELAVVVEEELPSIEFDEKAEDSIATTSLVPQSPTAVASPAATPRPKKRGLTDPTANVDRRISLNPFKRGQTIGGEVGKTTPASPTAGAEPQRRLSMAASLSNMRRSVVGTLSRPKVGGDGSRGRKFDASHLPPSPTLPNGPARSRVGAASLSPPASPRPRQAVSPVMYNRGSILLETAGIEDEESRRMTELAFLG